MVAWCMRGAEGAWHSPQPISPSVVVILTSTPCSKPLKPCRARVIEAVPDADAAGQIADGRQFERIVERDRLVRRADDERLDLRDGQRLDRIEPLLPFA